jgi:hypothetical protein
MLFDGDANADIAWQSRLARSRPRKKKGRLHVVHKTTPIEASHTGRNEGLHVKATNESNQLN